MTPYFQYGKKEVDYLKKADKKLGSAIEQIGVIKRAVEPDLFTSLAHAIVSQQISSKARNTIWRRFETRLEEITPDIIYQTPLDDLQQLGISFRKAAYIKSAADAFYTGALKPDELHTLPDEEVIIQLTKLPGIGVWTAEMLLLFTMQRPNILSYGDFAILRGMRMLYGLRDIDRERFRKYHRRYSPYAPVASLYLWQISSGVIEGLVDKGAVKKK